MASTQQAHQGANQFSDKEKATIDQAMKEAQILLEQNNKNAKAGQEEQLALVTGVMKNSQNRAIMLSKTHSWNGKFLVEPSKIGETAFVHQGDAAAGSKGAIVFGTIDLMYPGLAWLTAWDKPNNSDGAIKVYVEAGNISKFANIDWTEIEAKLDASHYISRYWDSDTGASSAARISNHGDNYALVGATFDRFLQ